MPKTSVEIIFDREPSDIARVILQLKDFFLAPERRAALRLSVLGLVDKAGQERHWNEATKNFKNLFPEDFRARISPGNTLSFHGNTIRRFATGMTDNKDRRLEAYLALYVIHQIELRPNLSDRVLINEAFSIDNTFNRVNKFLKEGNPAVLSPHTSGYDLQELIATLRKSFDIENDRAIADNMFPGQSALSASTMNISNYVMYRYSTKRKEIVKSFLPILSPNINELGCYSFTHVYAQEENSRRISRGILMAFQRSIYFLSGSGMAVGSGPIAPAINFGVKTFAIPYVAFAPDHRRLTGLMLSNTLTWYPVIGRFALIHIGFTEHPSEITDQTVGITFLERSELKQDISAIYEQFGCGTQEEAGQTFEYVTEVINNYPKVDRDAGLSKDGLLRALTIEEGREPAK